MKTSTHRLTGWLARERGSALILTILILLVLSGLGMVALRNVASSVQQSGAYRVRAQADTFSEAAVDYASIYAGNSAERLYEDMQLAQAGRINDPDNDTSTNKTATAGVRASMGRVGPHLVLHQRPGEKIQFGDLDTKSDTVTGLVSGGSANSFEHVEKGAEFSVVFRNPIDGPAIPGYDSECRYKKVTIASRGRVGKPDKKWEGANMFGEKRHGIEVFIGPINCGQQ